MTTDVEDGPEVHDVQQGWRRVESIERLGHGEVKTIFAPYWKAERERSVESFRPLEMGPGRDKWRRAYESPANLVRYRRTLDFLTPGERIFEVGVGKGYLAGMMLRDGQAAGYHGIDIVAENVIGTRKTLTANGFDDRATIQGGDLYELTREQVSGFGADLVVCCEVLEHVPDPEAALQVLAGALPDGADLLISVPLLRRLENVWGHVAIFDSPRIRAMLESAGLHAHLVDVVDNSWVLVLASRDPASSAHAERAAQAVSKVAETLDLLVTPRAVHNVAPSSRTLLPSRWTRGLSRADVQVAGPEVVCTFDAEPSSPLRTIRRRGRRQKSFGGVRFAVSELRGLRVEIRLDDIETVSAAFVDFLAGDQRVMRWEWDVQRHRPESRPATFVLRPGFNGLYFKAGRVGDLSTADSVELFVQLARGGRARFTLTRLGLIV
ncbi:MAG: class I SAM-dependent methyltransferase [Nocardioidaceae bacterium]